MICVFIGFDLTKKVEILKIENFTQTLLGGGDVEYGHSYRETMFYIGVVIMSKLEILGKLEIFQSHRTVIHIVDISKAKSSVD